jgi:uncharacterized phage-associated protein
MSYTAKAVANEFIALAKKDGRQLTPMQLQKLVYFAYGWYLAITGERLIDERVEAWQWGPVVPSLYLEFKRFGSDPVTEPSADYYFKDGKMQFKFYELNSGDPGKDDAARMLIKRVWDIYGKYSAAQLSDMTHEPNSPWSTTPGKEIKGTDIDDEEIKRYFRRLANEQSLHATR